MTTQEHVLSDEQQAAVACDDPSIVVVASAGSGKTEVVARRVERLLLAEPAAAFRILALSYTVKAADELRARFTERLGDLQRRVDTNTVHGFAHALLRQHGTRIGLAPEPEVLVRDEDRAELLGRWFESEGRRVPDDLHGVLRSLDLARARLQTTEYLDEWQEALSASGSLDFASMLTRCEELLGLRSASRQLSRLYGHVVVDEAQNLTPQQYSFLRALLGPRAEPHAASMVVGDDKQSIVGFAGADPTLIAQYEHDYEATRFELRKNFRSADTIVRLAHVVAGELGHATDADEQTAYAAAGLISTTESSDEAEEGRAVAQWVSGLLESGLPADALAPGEPAHVRPEEIAVLGRSAAALLQTRDALATQGIPTATASTPDDWLATSVAKVAFEIVALQSASDHRSTHWQLARLLGVDEESVRTVDDLASTLQLHPDESLRLLAPLCSIDDPARFLEALGELDVPDQDGERLASWEADCAQLRDAWEEFANQADAVERTWGNFRLHVARVQRGNDLDDGVRLVTIHKAQGREYRAVAVLGLNDGQIPDFRANSPEDRTFELRTFYVAVTRPTRVLLLSRARSRTTRYGPRATDPSPYLRFVAASRQD